MNCLVKALLITSCVWLYQQDHRVLAGKSSTPGIEILKIHFWSDG